MLFDIAHIPFSRAGRFLTLSTMKSSDGPALYLRSVKGGDLRPALGRLCRISFANENGQTVVPDFVLTPEKLTATTPEGSVDFVIGEGERLHVRGKGLKLVFRLEGSRYDYAYVTPSGDHCLVAAFENTRILPRAMQGDVTVAGQWRADHADNVEFIYSGLNGFEGTIDLFTALPPAVSTTSFAQVHHDAKSEFDAWLNHVPAARNGGEAARKLAAYLLWANTVPAAGLLTRPTIYMSKNHMINIWSWDNAFSALGVAAIDDALAFDQFAAIFDHQHESGLLPDFVNDRDASFAFTKPPVHGWAIGLITQKHPEFLTADRRAYFIDHLTRQVRYWLDHTRADTHSLPAYYHGNDSGWDNASFFAEGGPVLSPDLATFLILACEALADLTKMDAAIATAWRDEASKLTVLLLNSLWSGETFGTRLMAAPDDLHLGQSLIQYIPLMLGKKLPSEITQKLINRLKASDMLTQWGPATESPSSDFYVSDGYWRGPIWAPTTCLLWSGLVQQGEMELADKVAKSFCTLCETSGMAENFDAVTGAPLRDRGFAWTSAVYLLLSSSLHCADKGGGVHEH